MKHLVSIEAVTKPFDGFWMKPAYRIPRGKFPIVQHFDTQVTAANEPITEMVVNSLITSPADGGKFASVSRSRSAASPGTAATASARVEISVDNGNTWQEAALGQDLGRFAFRAWSFPSCPRPASTRSWPAPATRSARPSREPDLTTRPAITTTSSPLTHYSRVRRLR